MSWVVDTCILLDILEDDPEFGRASARCLTKHLKSGLVACPVSLVEMAPAFSGNLAAQEEFLHQCGVSFAEAFLLTDVRNSYSAWNACISTKRLRKSPNLPKRPIADILIGGFASRFDGLITRNGTDFQNWFPELILVDPTIDNS